jgi:hypothetical protein
MNRHITCAIILGLSVFIQVEAVQAESLTREIPAGSSFGQVLGLWGEPVDKVDKSVKGEVIWYYPDGAKVVFKNGQVRSWRPTNAIVSQRKQFSGSQLPATPASGQLSQETRDLVRDIAKEVPSGPDVPMPDAPPPPALNQPPLIPNQVPPGGRGAPPGLVPGEVMLDEDEED